MLYETYHTQFVYFCFDLYIVSLWWCWCMVILKIFYFNYLNLSPYLFWCTLNITYGIGLELKQKVSLCFSLAFNIQLLDRDLSESTAEIMLWTAGILPTYTTSRWVGVGFISNGPCLCTDITYLTPLSLLQHPRDEMDSKICILNSKISFTASSGNRLTLWDHGDSQNLNNKLTKSLLS